MEFYYELQQWTLREFNNTAPHCQAAHYHMAFGIYSGSVYLYIKIIYVMISHEVKMQTPLCALRPSYFNSGTICGIYLTKAHWPANEYKKEYYKISQHYWTLLNTNKY